MEKKKIVKKKADQTTPDPSCSGGERVHKKPWQETQATSKDIEEFLNRYVILRHNTVTGQPEFRVPECDEFESLGMQYITGTTPLDEWRSATEWHNVCDRFVNSLINMLSRQKDVSERVMWRVINSDYVPLYNPFETYLSRLPPWDGTTNHIMDLASTVTVKGGAEELLLFYACLRKWLVAMIAGWLDDDVVNQEILVLVGRQGIYKTTWFNSLLPPALERYFHSNTSFGNMTKDEVLKLSMYGLICCEELDTMKPSEMNRLKWAVTTTVTDERRPYAHYSERRNHIARATTSSSSTTTRARGAGCRSRWSRSSRRATTRRTTMPCSRRRMPSTVRASATGLMSGRRSSWRATTNASRWPKKSAI